MFPDTEELRQLTAAGGGVRSHGQQSEDEDDEGGHDG